MVTVTSKLKSPSRSRINTFVMVKIEDKLSAVVVEFDHEVNSTVED